MAHLVIAAALCDPGATPRGVIEDVLQGFEDYYRSDRV
jgi:hypothetical protein